MRIAVPALCGLVLVAYLLGETVAIDHDLRVVAPSAALPGQGLPVRAFLYGQLRAVQGARLVQGRLSARVLDGAGTELVAAPMRLGHAGSYECTLRLPDGVTGALRLQVRAAVDDGETLADGTLQVGPTAGPLAAVARSLRVLQQLSHGPLRALSGAQAPSRLQAVVGGGGCVPEQPCGLWVHVGAPAASIALEPTAAITPLTGPSAPTDSVAAQRVRIHGPEAVARLTASRDGQPVAQRSVRLPVLLGAGGLRVEGRPVAGVSGATSGGVTSGGLRVALGGEPGSCIVDAYRDGHWVDTVTVADCGLDAPQPVALADLPPGLWRLQVRRDAFDNASASVAALRIAASGADTPVAALSQLASAVQPLDRSDALAAQVRADPARFARLPAQADAIAGYLLAKLEQGVIPLPPAITSYAEASRRFAERRQRAKFVTLVALVLSGLCLGLIVARRGLAASAQAREIMAEAGDAHARDRRRRLTMTLRVLGVMASILLAFIVIALYVVARGISLN